jgi:cell division protease FtsH
LHSTGITPNPPRKKIDDEINKLINDAYQRSKDVLMENMDILHKLAEELLEKETVMGKELDELIVALRPGIKLPSNADENPDKEDARSASEPV